MYGEHRLTHAAGRGYHYCSLAHFVAQLEAPSENPGYAPCTLLDKHNEM